MSMRDKFNTIAREVVRSKEVELEVKFADALRMIYNQLQRAAEDGKFSTIVLSNVADCYHLDASEFMRMENVLISQGFDVKSGGDGEKYKKCEVNWR